MDVAILSPMLKRGFTLPPEHLYPADEWRIVETRYSDDYVGRTETAFSLGNGFLGVRGTFEEGAQRCRPDVRQWLARDLADCHAEEARGLARVGQTIVNVPDGTIFKLYVDDEPLFLPTAQVRDYRRILDMRAGTLTRDFVLGAAQRQARSGPRRAGSSRSSTVIWSR